MACWCASCGPQARAVGTRPERIRAHWPARRTHRCGSAAHGTESSSRRWRTGSGSEPDASGRRAGQGISLCSCSGTAVASTSSSTPSSVPHAEVSPAPTGRRSTCKTVAGAVSVSRITAAGPPKLAPVSAMIVSRSVRFCARFVEGRLRCLGLCGVRTPQESLNQRTGKTECEPASVGRTPPTPGRTRPTTTA